MSLGKNIKKERVLRDIKQQDLALELEITPQYLRKIEKGEVDVKLSLIIKIAKALDITVNELIEE
ncbi:regulatory protein,anaerobic benzoate catabolism transcriptional regulator,Predicted transcriptional regulator,transcriptional regulator, y4mF family,Helix-turn-helix [[Clostridium] sordellii]|uniref:helix-turn-helix domain-containing protein n=1 Tax=Paraclostridium sordellii TaxID=1505 RepID=UPI0005427478|nr:helix-turn-helix transcriptional regulator [Paeniclostridium sordellii]CEK34615.1 regulatory protein,anaerobic benzoate catabolism transcriptional regulator,Predicted transcriptional regulator,transcriptional regulator, y4mF family,Helix-turn-helix [[Clostridium] sordellii] [Paeniclostridium sordellii]